MSDNAQRDLTVFDYAEHFLLRLADAHDHTRPLQVELHPGLHCDLYRCPHCYGHGQPPVLGQVLEAADVARMLDELGDADPLIVISGITTEPLTHPDGAGIIRAVRSRNFRLGLFTKGHRFDAACQEAMLLGDSECFVTFSVDAANRATYETVHNIAVNHVTKATGLRGSEYYDQVLANIAAFYEARRRRGARGSHVQIRVALLLFDENCSDGDVDAAVSIFSSMADIVRFAFPQTPNAGFTLPNVPQQRASRLQELKQRYRGHKKVRILTNTSEPDRNQDFQHCHTQKFQITVDKSGNLFPCPQVAVSNYAHLSFGNIRSAPLPDLLNSLERLRLFSASVTDEMKCRICDRKDEAINVTIDRLQQTFRVMRRYGTGRFEQDGVLPLTSSGA